MVTRFIALTIRTLPPRLDPKTMCGAHPVSVELQRASGGSSSGMEGMIHHLTHARCDHHPPSASASFHAQTALMAARADLRPLKHSTIEMARHISAVPHIASVSFDISFLPRRKGRSCTWRPPRQTSALRSARPIRTHVYDCAHSTYRDSCVPHSSNHTLPSE